MQYGFRYVLTAIFAAAVLSACGAGAGVGVSSRDSHIGARGSIDLNNGSSSVTPYGKIGAGVEVTR